MKIVQQTGCEPYRIKESRHGQHAPAHDGALKTTDQSMDGTQLDTYFQRLEGFKVCSDYSKSTENENIESGKTRKFPHR